MNRTFRKLCLSFVSLALMFFLSACSLFSNSEYVETSLREMDSGLRNPLMGFRLPFFGAENYQSDVTEADYQSILKERPYGTLSREYLNWIELEYDGNSDFDFFLERSEEILNQIEKFNIKVTPRVILNWPGQNDAYSGVYWPTDMNAYDYESEQFQERLSLMVHKMAMAWDNDPRIAYIEMGIFGQWGEQHTPAPSAEMQAFAADLFNSEFLNKKVMVRYHYLDLYQNNENIGIYWDEWGSNTQYDSWDQINLVETEEFKDRWKKAVFGGETTFNQAFDPSLGGGRFMTFGFNAPFTADDAFTTGLPEVLKYIGLTHTNHVDMVMTPGYNSLNDKTRTGFDAAQNAMGYKMVISDVKYTRNIATERELEIELDITNQGASPFYYDWPVSFSLLDPKTNNPVYSDVFSGVSTMDFLPGEEWDTANAEFAIAPVTHTISETFTIPESLANGKYLLAVTMLDPAGMVPAARFANTSSIQGGYTGLGYVGIAKKVLFTNYRGSNDYMNDSTLCYYQNIGLFASATLGITSISEITDGVSSSAYVATTGENSLVIELEENTKVLSVETVWENLPEYEIFTSEDGITWKPAGRVLAGRNETGRNIVNEEDVGFVKIVFVEGLTEDIRLYTVNVYGE